MDTGPALVKSPHPVRSIARRAARFVLDQLYPPVCLHCRAPTEGPDGLCGECWRQMQPISSPLCPRLGLPFAVDMGPAAWSAEAIANPPPFDRARAAFVYSKISSALVSRLKYGDHPELARFCARTMIAAAAELLRDDPVLVPVPLHRLRQLGRRYNQSTELAREMAFQTGLEMAPLLVHRVLRTRQQVGLSAEQRARNVAGAFRVSGVEAGQLAGRRLVLIDDVMTTGATIKAMTGSLKSAGFDQIDVVTFARVVIGTFVPI